MTSLITLLGDNGAGGAGSSQIYPKVRVSILPVAEGKTVRVELSSVSCVDVRFCIAVGTRHPYDTWAPAEGDMPAVMRFDGLRWSKVDVPSPTNAELHGVDCVTRTWCVAVGQEMGAPLIEELHGAKWSLVPTPKPTFYVGDYSFMESVSCSSVSECTAVGWDIGTGYPRGVEPSVALVEQRSATGWSVDSPAAPLVPTSSPSVAGNVMVPENSADLQLLTSVSCTPERCIGVSNEGSVVIKGEGWSGLSMYSPPAAGVAVTAPSQLFSFDGVSCSDQVCAAVGSAGTGLVHHVVGEPTLAATLMGASWQRVPSANTRAQDVLDAVSCLPASSCVAVGAAAGPPLDEPWLNRGDGALVEIETNGRWVIGLAKQVPSNEDDTLVSVSCPTSRLCIAVGPSSVGQQIPSGPVHVYSVRINH